MSDDKKDKLGSWLNKFGTSSAPEAKSTFQKTKPENKLVGQKSSKPAGKKPHKTTSTRAKTSARPATKSSKPAPRGSKKTSTHPRANTHSKPRSFSSNDPNKDRKTFDSRDRFHPTNRLKPGKKGDIRVVPLGGMEQVGENMMFLEWDNDIVVIDTGVVFGGANGYGVDSHIADVSYLEKNKNKIRGVIYTHGHLDHIGGTPYILPKLGFPKVYATRLTRDMLLAQCEEHPGVKDQVNVTDITPKSKIKLGKFEIEFFHINHSIPDGVGIAVKTPYGYIVNTSDFKIDHNPADEQPADLERIAHIGHQGVAVAMVDSTNALRGGHAMSETIIKDTLNKILHDATGRVIVATFSSNVGRVARLVESAEAQGRTVFLTGRSMERNITIARKLNFLRCKDNTLQRMSRKVSQMDPRKVLILSTGSQGEELAALTRMAAGTHKDVKLSKEDTIVFSSSPIPGNESAVGSVLDNLAELGIDHIDNKQLDVHVSGHGHREELKLMTALLNPKYCAPIHGEVHMRYGHKAMLVKELGYKEENCFIMKNGQGVVLNEKGCRLMTDREAVPAAQHHIQERRPLSAEAVDERKLLANSGALIVQLKHDKGSLKKITFRDLGFLINDKNHEFYKQLEANIKQTWVKNYDASRPESVIEKQIKSNVDTFVLKYLNLRKDPIVEVIVTS